VIQSSILIAAFIALTPIGAHAYLDPGTGSYVTQVVVGFALGGLYLIKVFWIKIIKAIKSFFHFFNRNEEKNNS